MKERRNITGKVFQTPQELEKSEREFLRKLTPEERIALTWELSKEQWGLKAEDDESRLSRHHTRLIRR
jgi:hypothetical protein